MDVVLIVTGTIYEYTLSTAADPSTYSLANSYSTGYAATWGVHLSDDGTKMYTNGYDGTSFLVAEYSLSTAWDMSTASYDSVSFSVSSQDTAPFGVTFNDDGTKMYILGLVNDSVFQYSLSTAYDLSTASYDSVSFSFTSQDNAPIGFVFNNDGTKAFMSGNTGDSVYQYTLSTAYDISTLSYDSVSFSVSQEINPQGITFNNDGSKMYILGSTSDTVYQYTSGDGGIYPTESPITVYGLTNGTSYTFNVWAINASGWSAPSAASESVAPVATLALFMGGSHTSGSYDSNVIDYIQIATTGNGTDWGDTTLARGGSAPASNSTRGISAGGGNIYITEVRDRIDYITFASTGNASVFGNLTQARYYRVGGISNDTRGVFVTGRNSSFQGTQTTDYVTIATTGNATNYGNYGISLREGPSGCSSTTRGILCGGLSETNVQYNNIYWQ